MKHHPCVIFWLFCCIFVVATSCVSEIDSTKSGTASIAGNQGKGGIPAMPGDPGTSSTVALMSFDSSNNSMNNTCTGSLIGKNQVLTAAHCVRNAMLDGDYYNIRYIGFGLDVTAENIELRKVTHILFHRDSWIHARNELELAERLKTSPKPTQDESDIALIEFEGDLPAGYAPIPLIDSAESVKVGTEIRIVGYGIIEVNKPESSGVLRYGMMQSRGVRSTSDFTAGPISPENYDTCYGDSGGPALVLENGIWKLAGITSDGLQENNGLCEKDGGSFTLVTAFSDWLQTAQARMGKMEVSDSVIPLAHPLDEADDNFKSFVNDCEKTEPGSDEAHTYAILKAIAQQTTCLDTARVVFSFSQLYLDFTGLGYIGPGFPPAYHIGEIAKIPIKNVKPLSYLTNLQVLGLTGHKVNDLKPLARLNKLWSLDLSQNNIASAHLSDITSALSTSLIILDLSGNRLTTLDGMERFTKLTGLYLNNNQLSDLTPLYSLKDLFLLFADSNRIEEVQPLANLTNLVILSLNKNVIKEVRPLANLYNLQALMLIGNQITEISSLSSLTKLTYLDLRNNPLPNNQQCPVPESPENSVCFF